MDSLVRQLDTCFRGHLCVLGLGSDMGGDDAFGVQFVTALQACHPGHSTGHVVLKAVGTDLERQLGSVTRERYDHVIVCDAADFGAAPGDVAWLEAAQIQARFPQISTHRLCLGLVAAMLEANGHTRAWLLAVQAGPCRSGPRLSPAVARTSEALRTAFLASWAAAARAQADPPLALNALSRTNALSPASVP